MKKQKKNTGITLVALIVTIIILLILAGVTIMQLTESGLFEKAKQAEQKSENAQIEEETTVADYENKIGEYLNSSRMESTNVLDNLKNYKEIYTSGMIADNQTVSYTLDKSYPIIIVVVSGIGSASGTDATTSSISVTNTSKELIKLIDNESAPYSSYKYYSTVSMAYMVNPTSGTTFTCGINYRGSVHIYSLGD